MDLPTAFVVIIWISGAFGMWGSMASSPGEKPLRWYDHIACAAFSFYWPFLVPGIAVFKLFERLEGDGSEQT